MPRPYLDGSGDGLDTAATRAGQAASGGVASPISAVAADESFAQLAKADAVAAQDMYGEQQGVSSATASRPAAAPQPPPQEAGKIAGGQQQGSAAEAGPTPMSTTEPAQGQQIQQQQQEAHGSPRGQPVPEQAQPQKAAEEALPMQQELQPDQSKAPPPPPSGAPRMRPTPRSNQVLPVAEPETSTAQIQRHPIQSGGPGESGQIGSEATPFPDVPAEALQVPRKGIPPLSVMEERQVEPPAESSGPMESPQRGAAAAAGRRCSKKVLGLETVPSLRTVRRLFSTKISSQFGQDMRRQTLHGSEPSDPTVPDLVCGDGELMLNGFLNDCLTEGNDSPGILGAADPEKNIALQPSLTANNTLKPVQGRIAALVSVHSSPKWEDDFKPFEAKPGLLGRQKRGFWRRLFLWTRDRKVLQSMSGSFRRRKRSAFKMKDNVRSRPKKVRFAISLFTRKASLWQVLMQNCVPWSDWFQMYYSFKALLCTFEVWLLPMRLAMYQQLRDSTPIRVLEIMVDGLMFVDTVIMTPLSRMSMDWCEAHGKDVPALFVLGEQKTTDDQNIRNKKLSKLLRQTIAPSVLPLDLALRLRFGRHLIGYVKFKGWVNLMGCTGMYISAVLGAPLWVSELMFIPRLLRLFELYQFFRSKELDVRVDVRFVALFKFLVLVVGTAHWIGCLFYYLAQLADFTEARSRTVWIIEWQNYLGIDFDVHTSSFMYTYMVILFKGFNTLTNLGYDAVVPQRHEEMLLSIAVILVKIVLEGYILGTLFGHLVKKDANVEAFRQKMACLMEYCSERNLPTSLQRRLVSYFEFQNRKNSRGDHQKVMQHMPMSLRLKLAEVEHSTLVRRNAFLFHGCNQQFLTNCMLKLREVFLMPNELFMVEGDMPREMCFVKQGFLEVVNRKGIQIQLISHEGNGPNVCGYISFFMGFQQCYSVKARRTADVTVLTFNKFDYEELVASYPEQHDIIMRNLLSQFDLEKTGTDLGLSSKRNADEDWKEMKLLIQQSLQKRIAEDLGMMTYAASEGDLDKVKTLLARGLPIDAGDYDQRTTLHLAAAESRMDVVQVLLVKGANPNVVDRWGSTPMHDAVDSRSAPVVNILVQYGAKVNYNDPCRTLNLAALESDFLRLELLLRSGVDPRSVDYDHRTILHLVAADGRLPIMERLLNSGKVDVNALDRWNGTPLENAIKTNQPLVSKLLRMYGGKMRASFGRTQLLQAAKEGNVALGKQVLECGINVNSVNYDNETAAHMAAKHGQLLFMHLLLSSHANPNSQDRWGKTPLSNALMYNHVNCCCLLTAAGGDLIGGIGYEELRRKKDVLVLPDIGTIRNAIKMKDSAMNTGSRSNIQMSQDMDNLLKKQMMVEGLRTLRSLRRLALSLHSNVEHCQHLTLSLMLFLQVCLGRLKMLAKDGKGNQDTSSLKKPNGKVGEHGLQGTNSMDSKQPMEYTHSWYQQLLSEHAAVHEHFVQIRVSAATGGTASARVQFNQIILKFSSVERAMLHLYRVVDNLMQRDVELDSPRKLLAALLRQLGLEASPVDRDNMIRESTSFCSDQLSLIGLMSSSAFMRVLMESAEGILKARRTRHNSASDESSDHLGFQSVGMSEKDAPNPERMENSSGLVMGLIEAIHIMNECFNLFDVQQHGVIYLSDLHGSQQSLGELKLDQVRNVFSQCGLGSESIVNRKQFTEVFLAWVGVEELKEDEEKSSLSSSLGEDDDSHGSLDDAMTLMNKMTLRYDEEDESHRISPEQTEEHELSAFLQKTKLKPQTLHRWLRTCFTPVRGRVQHVFSELDWKHSKQLNSREVVLFLRHLNNACRMPSLFTPVHLTVMPKRKEMECMMDLMDADRSLTISMDEIISVLGGPHIHPVTDDQAQQTLAPDTSCLVIPPWSPYIQKWDAFIRWLALFFFLDVPFDIAFGASHRLGAWFVSMNRVIDMLLLVDGGLRFLRAYYNKKSVLVCDLRRIQKHYLKTTFVIDLVAAIPLDLFVSPASASDEYQAWLRLPKLLRLYLVWKWYSTLDKSVNADTVWGGVLRLVPLILALSHVCACIWWYIGTKPIDDDLHDDPEAEIAQHWIGNFDGLGFEKPWKDSESIVSQYLLTFYWILTTLSTSGLVGEMMPKNVLELVFTCVTMILTLTMFTWVLGEMTNIVVRQDDELVTMRSEVAMVQDFVSQRKLPKELQTDIENYISGVSSKRSSATSIFSDLSHLLQIEVAKNISRNLLDNCSILQPCKSNFLDSLSVLLREIVYAPEEYIIRVNELGRDLYIIAAGTVEMTVVNESDGESVVGTKSAYETLGELSFFFGVRQLSNGKAWRKGPVTCFCIEKASFMSLAKLYPESEEEIQNKVLQSWDMSRGGGGRSTMSHTTADSQALDDMTAVRRILEQARKRRHNEKVIQMVTYAAENNLAGIKTLLEHSDINIDEGDYDDRTALHLAASNGHVEMCRVLVEGYHANVNCIDRSKGSPLTDAIRHRHVDVIRLLRERGAKIPSTKADMVMDICNAAKAGNLEAVTVLVEAGVDPNITDHEHRTALHVAASEGHAELVTYLCSQENIKVSPVDALGNTPLVDAIHHGHEDIQKLLFHCGGRFSHSDMAGQLCEAAAKNDLLTIERFHRNGLDLGTMDTSCRTALHLAASSNSLKVADFLLTQVNVDLNSLDSFCHTPLDDAISQKHPVMQLLLEQHGALRGFDPALEREREARLSNVGEQRKRDNHQQVMRLIQQSPEIQMLPRLEARIHDIGMVVGDVVNAISLVEGYLRQLTRSTLEQEAWSQVQSHIEALLVRECKTVQQKLQQVKEMISPHPVQGSEVKRQLKLCCLLSPGLRPILETLREDCTTVCQLLVDVLNHDGYNFESFKQKKYKGILKYGTSYFLSTHDEEEVGPLIRQHRAFQVYRKGGSCGMTPWPANEAPARRASLFGLHRTTEVFEAVPAEVPLADAWKNVKRTGLQPDVNEARQSELI